MPYKYVVDVSSRPFSDAPDPLLASLGRLTWAAKQTVKAEEFQKPNELLTLGYLEKMSINVSASPKEVLLYMTDLTSSTMTTARNPLDQQLRHFPSAARRQ